MRCYLTKTGCVSRPLEPTAHLSLISSPEALHNCPHCSADVNSLTDKKLILYLEICCKELLMLAWIKTCVKGVGLKSAVVMKSKSGHASTALKVSLGGVLKQGIFVSVKMVKDPPSWVSPWCFIRTLGQVQPDPSELSEVFPTAQLFDFSHRGLIYYYIP